MMVRLLALIIILMCFFVFMRTGWIWKLNRKRRKRGAFDPGQATLFDVKEFLIDGEKEMAVRVYREIFQVNQEEALKAVEDLEKNLKT